MKGRTTLINDFIEKCEKAGILIDFFVDFSPALIIQYLKQNHKNIDEIIVIKNEKAQRRI